VSTDTNRDLFQLSLWRTTMHGKPSLIRNFDRYLGKHVSGRSIFGLSATSLELSSRPDGSYAPLVEFFDKSSTTKIDRNCAGRKLSVSNFPESRSIDPLSSCTHWIACILIYVIAIVINVTLITRKCSFFFYINWLGMVIRVPVLQESNASAL
jgi:hypothetical protein